MRKIKLIIWEFLTLHDKKLLSVTKTFWVLSWKRSQENMRYLKCCVDYCSETFYHIGLDVYPCGDKQECVFTNGAEYKASSNIKGAKLEIFFFILNALMTIPFHLVLSQTAFNKNKGPYVLTNRLQLLQKLLRIKMITTKWALYKL